MKHMWVVIHPDNEVIGVFDSEDKATRVMNGWKTIEFGNKCDNEAWLHINKIELNRAYIPDIWLQDE